MMLILLVDAFNPLAIDELMCRNILSVGWDGKLFDCEFNQMSKLDTESDCPSTIHDSKCEKPSHHQITLGQHCVGYTAGAQSGCQGAIEQDGLDNG